MKSKFLFPHWCQFLGYFFLFVAFLIYLAGSSYDYGNMPNGPITNDNEYLVYWSGTLSLVIGFYLTVFSKEKIEDEQIFQLRMDSMQWAFHVLFILLIFFLLFLSDAGHQARNAVHFVMRFLPVFYIIRFRWVIVRLNLSLKKDIKRA